MTKYNQDVITVKKTTSNNEEQKGNHIGKHEI
jgi:hypothetical protein